MQSHRSCWALAHECSSAQQQQRAQDDPWHVFIFSACQCAVRCALCTLLPWESPPLFRLHCYVYAHVAMLLLLL